MTVAIVGAGVGGVALGVKLRQAGFRHFTIFEKSAGVGGTWHDNTYPGCEVDIHSHFYSFSFMPHDWTSSHARQPELRQYVEDTVDHFGLRPHIRLSTRVVSATWNDPGQCYEVVLDDGSTHQFDVLVSATGILNIPRYPDWPGLADFVGVQFHTARWEHDHDLRGKRVAFVGTGSTASQAVPELANIVDHLYLFQREPGWVVPKGEVEFSDADRARYRRSRLWRTWCRYKQYRATAVLLKSVRVSGTDGNRLLTEKAKQYIATEIDDPVLREQLTPSYPFGCKRIIQASTFYNALRRSNVTLVPHAVERVTTSGVVGADGIEREVDAVIIGTGFQAQNFLGSLNLKGLHGRDIQEVWGQSAKAMLGVTVSGFPNFFMIYGPNTNGGGSIIHQNELQAAAIVRSIKKLRRGATSIDTKPTALAAYTWWIDEMNAKYLSATLECHNYFYAPDGRNVTQWPLSHLKYHLGLRFALPLALQTQTKHRTVQAHCDVPAARTAVS